MYYTLKLSDNKKQLWDVIKYTNIPTPETRNALLMTTKYTYNKSEIIKSSLSYNDANNLVTMLKKLNPKK